MAQRGEPSVGELRQHVGQVLERRAAGEHHVERGVAQQLEGEREPLR